MGLISKIKKVCNFYRSANKKKMFGTFCAVKRQYGIRGLKIAISNKANGRLLLYNLQKGEVGGETYTLNGVSYDQIGNELFEKQQIELTLEQINEHIENFNERPLISVLMPIYNPPIKWLEKAIESLQAQYYTNWELCAVDDGSTDGRGCALIEKMLSEDSRIRLHKLEKNGGISTASNYSLKMANGKFCALMDQDDEITSDAFFWFVKEINENPEADLIYSDECKIGCGNQIERTDFYFKPDWSLSLLINHMYTGHLSVYRTELMRKIGGFRSEYDFSQDYDLALRISDVTKNIRHIERVLYYWRTLPTSGAAGGKDFARNSNLNALCDWYGRNGLTAIMEKKKVSNYGSVVMTKNPKVSVIIPTDSLTNLSECIDGLIMKTSYKNIEIIPVTNSKTAKDILSEYPYLQCLKICHYDKIYNFSDKCNEGAKIATGEVLAFYNDDVVPYSKDWIERQLEILMHPNVGGVSPLMIHEDHTIQYAGMITGTPGMIGTSFNGRDFHNPVANPFSHFLMRDVSVLCGACTLMKKEVFEEIGGYDSIHTPNGHSDLDLSFKLIEKDYRLVYTPYSILIHTGNHSWAAKNKADKADIYCLKRWGKYVSKDRFFTNSMKKMFYGDFNYKYELFSPENLIVPEKENSKDILFLTPELTRTGAPVVLQDMIKIVLENGDFPVVLSPVDGPLKQELLNMGVTVLIDESFMHGHWMFEHFARNFDLVVANTLGCGSGVNLLKDSLPPVLWWVHEGTYALKHFRHMLPRKLGAKTRVYSISEYTTKILKNGGINYPCEKLIWGVEDIIPKKGTKDEEGKTVFVIIGSIEERKGQDIVLDVIEKFDEKLNNQTKFIFVGNPLEKEIQKRLVDASEKYENVEYLKSMPREELFKLYEQADCAIIPSRDEPMSLIAVESMIFGKPFICSDCTGIAQYVDDGKNGMIFRSENRIELAEKIKFVVDHNSELVEMGKKARKIYEENFTMEHYRENFRVVIDKMISLK